VPAAPTPTAERVRPPAYEARARAHTAALELRAAAWGVREAHLQRVSDEGTPGHSDILIAEEGATRFLARARAQARADHQAHLSVCGLTGAALDADPSNVYFTTLKRTLAAYEATQRASKLGQLRTFHGILALQVVAGADIIISPAVPAQQWARRSAHTSFVVNLGRHLPTLAAKARQHGRRLLCSAEDFTTRACSHCGHQEARGGKLFLVCSACGLASHRDAGMAPNNIWKRALVHGGEARLALLARAAGLASGSAAAAGGGAQ
jgi:hypothetical protein